MIKELIQSTFDASLYFKEIFTYEQQKSGADAEQYIVYTFNGDSKEIFTDNDVIMKNASVTIKYYYNKELLNSKVSRQEVRGNEELIQSTLEDAGFSVPFGYFDGGDIDDIGFYVTIFECEYWRVV